MTLFFSSVLEQHLLLPPFFSMVGFPVQDYSGIGQMAIFITLHQKSESASGCNWHSFPWSWQVKIHYVSLSHFPGVFMGPISKDSERCSCSCISGTRMESVLLKLDYVLYCNTHFSYLWLQESPFTYTNNHTHCWEIVTGASTFLWLPFFFFFFLFRIPMGGRTTNTHYHYTECWNLRCSTYIYGKEIRVLRSSVCWYMYNKASGRSAIT